MKERFCTHNHSGRAEPALKSRIVDECLLKRIELPCLRIAQAFDCGDSLSVTFDGEHHAGEHRLSVHEYGTAPACPVVTGDLGAGKVKSLSQCMGQGMRGPNLIGFASNLQFVNLVIDCEGDATRLINLCFSLLCHFYRLTFLSDVLIQT
jgi:hypothetical protein